MQLCITLEHRFMRTPDGRVWTVTQCPYSFFQEYLEVFDSVRVIARAFPVDKAEAHFLNVEGPGVEFFALPAYKGPYGYLRNLNAVARRASNAVPEGSAVLLRAHSQVANVIQKNLDQRRYPYAVEVVADPFDVLSPAANQHPVAPVARRYFTARLKKQCQSAIAVAYVTKSYLQQRYPSRPESVSPQTAQWPGDLRQRTIGVSDVNLSEEAFVTRPRTQRHDPEELRILFVGTLESLYKGPDVLVDAVALCKAQDVSMRVRFIGGGKQMPALRERCARLGVHGVVDFVGEVITGGGVRKELDNADVFVLPSRAEGVPRAMLEAMARGLPCIGTNVGGIPELLDLEDMVPQNDAKCLANKLMEVATDPDRFRRMAERNLLKAFSYSRTQLSSSRQSFFEAVRDLTSAYLSKDGNVRNKRASNGIPRVRSARALKIAHVVEGCQGGVGTAVRHLIDSQANDEGVSGVYLFADPARMGDMLVGSAATMCPYRSSRNPLGILQVATTLQRQLDTLRPDVVFLHSTFPGVYGRLPVRNIQREWSTVYCAHGWAFTQQVSSLKRFAYMLIERALVGRSDGIVSVSQDEYISAVRGGLKHPFHRVILHGVPLADASLEPAVKPTAHSLDLLFIGRFDRQKGVDLLLKAWKDPRLTNVHLWLIGSATLGSGIPVPDLPNVHTLGWVLNQDIDRYIRSFDAVIMPSRWEGFGLVALEAMRNGRAVLASRTGGLKELVIDGANGRLFDPTDQEALVEMVSSLTRADLTKMGEVAEAVFRTGFTWDACYRRWNALSLEAMAHRSSTLLAGKGRIVNPARVRRLPELDEDTRSAA